MATNSNLADVKRALSEKYARLERTVGSQAKKRHCRYKVTKYLRQAEKISRQG